MDNTASYYRAMRQHNLATGNGSEEDQGFWDRVGNTVSNIPSFVKSTAISTGHGFYNTGAMLGNIFRGEEDKIEYINTQKWISEYDEDLGRYYRENATAVDAAGFVVGSLVPGMGGVRALNVGQKALSTAKTSGVIGSNTSRATGLLVPRTQAHIARASEQIASTNTMNRLLHADTLKALGSGVHQNILEAAAFESFAIAAQANSNFISEMEGKDILYNALTGVAIGGALGGLISGIGIRRQITDRVKKLDAQGNEAILQTVLPKNLPEHLKISNAQINKSDIETFITKLETDIATASDEMKPVLANHLSRARNTLTQLNNDIRENVIKASTHKEVGKLFARAVQDMPSSEAANWVVGITKFKRVGDMPAPPRRAKGDGQGTLKLGFGETQAELASRDHVWHKLWGDDAGKGIPSQGELPAVTALADRVKLKPGETIGQGIKRMTDSFKFSAKRSIDIMDPKINLNEVQARWWWAENVKLKGQMEINQADLPLLEAAMRQFDDVGSVKIVDGKGNVLREASSLESLTEGVVEAKRAALAKGINRKMQPNLIAEYTNIRGNYINGTEVADNITDNLFATQYYARQQRVEPKELLEMPQWMGAEIDKRALSELNPLELEAELLIAQQLKAHQESVDNAIAFATAPYGQLELDMAGVKGVKANLNIAMQLPENSVVQGQITNASRYGSGSRFLTSANGNYNSLESTVQRIGIIKSEMDKRGMSIVASEWDSVGRNLLTDRAAAAELSAINEMLAGKTTRFGIAPVQRSPSGELLAPEGTVMQLRPLADIDAGRMSDDVINISNPTTAKAIETHIKLNGQRVEGRKALRQSEGLDLDHDPRSFYPIKPDPRKTPFHAFVRDGTATGGTRTTMIHAGTAKDLEAMIQSIQRDYPNFKVVTKGQSDEYFRSLGEYDYSKTLNELDLDAALATKGVNSQILPQTDPELVYDKFVSWHNRQVQSFNTDIVTTKYAPEFDVLERMGRDFSNLSESMYPDITAMALHSKNNPYVEYVKTALNISNMSDYAKLSSANRAIDATVSHAWNSATNLFRNMRGVDMKTVDEINDVFAKVGFETPYKGMEAYLAANHRADTAVLSKFVRTSQSILATVFLRMDPLHSFNNKLGSILLTSTEARHVSDAARRGNTEIAGKLAELSRVDLPGINKDIFSPAKLISNAYKNLFTSPELRARAVAEGYVPSDITDAFRVIDTLSISGTETPKQLEGIMRKAVDGAKKLADVGERVTGNKWTEFANRFVSYDVMRQMTDEAVKAGIMTAKEAGTYINTFVGRTQVILNAAQRPLAFQGPVGMAMGLFQSYQFNLFQQLFRYVGDRGGRSVALMAGLQGSFYGMSGIPGFRYLNESVVGLGSGNLEHRDITSELPGAIGKDLAEFLLYGAPGKLFNTALHSRGDLTPQHPTVLPSRPSELPVVAMYSRIFGNMFNAMGNLKEGASMQQTFLTALEHNGFNRPLQGLAQVARGLSTGEVISTKKGGDFLASNDLWSLATMARLAGGKPLDEALVRDLSYRTNMYQRHDQDRRNRAAEALRVSMLGTGEYSNTQLDSVFDLYLRSGGDQARFNSWALGQMERATVPEAERLVQSLRFPYNQRMQELMGGY